MLLNKQISIIYFIRLIKWDLISIISYALLVGALDDFSFFAEVSIPLGVSALIGTLLSLLLAFRTSQSYERWWEARIVWGAIVNDSRTLIRQLIQFLPAGSEKEEQIREFAERQSMWCYSLADTLRQVDYSSHLATYIAANKLDAENFPNKILTYHAIRIFELTERYNINPNRQVQLDSTIQRLTDSMGKCERIKNTVFPRSYSVMIHFMIYVLMTIIPFGLDHNHSLVEIFLATLVPALFIAIERTAILMQDPFENRPTDTPMTTLSTTIERNLMEMAGTLAPERQAVDGTYYVM